MIEGIDDDDVSNDVAKSKTSQIYKKQNTFDQQKQRHDLSLNKQHTTPTKINANLFGKLRESFKTLKSSESSGSLESRRKSNKGSARKHLKFTNFEINLQHSS